MGDITKGSNGRLQVKTLRSDGWTKTRRTHFLTALAQTCNVRLAARVVGKTPGSARALRQRDGEFSLLWDEALEAGYEHLESELLSRALGLTISEDNPTLAEIVDGPAQVAFDPDLAIQVLKLRGNLGRDAGRGGGRGKRPPPMTQGEIDAALIERIEAMRMPDA